MTESDPPPITDPIKFSQNMAQVAAQSQKIAAMLMATQNGAPDMAMPSGPDAMQTFAQVTTGMFADPAKLLQSQITMWQDYLNLWQNAVSRSIGLASEDVVKAAPRDRRFADAEWNDHPIFNFIKQSYLLAARNLQQSVREIDGLDEATAMKIDFYTRQFIDAMAPTNYLMTNPEVLRATIESNGENLVRGLDHMAEDLERGKGQLVPKMTDLDAFEVGRNVAVTPGKVIYQNELMQLIQYAPTTETVYRRPLLIIPPWINKYYILDLRPDNSLVKWSLDQGYTVFMISWVNPDPSLSQKGFEDYMFQGPLAALDAIEQATGETEVNAFGYCLGGTLLASTLAYMAAHEDERITSATLLAAQMDFTDAGELMILADEAHLSYLERRMERQGGVLDGATMATAFNMLRANDLIWTFVVSNYLLGREPMPFDLLYWNSDATRLPSKMLIFYLRNLYQKNLLVQPGALELGGTPIDLRKVRVPMYMEAAKEDHIAPYTSVFTATKQFSGPVRYILAGSGHIAGAVNPPHANKYQHWTNEAGTPYERGEDWLADAVEHPGSWWPDWHAWLSAQSGEDTPARIPGAGALAPIEDAPGSYVRVRS